MATIPIEIILQDAETPVDPTPTPEETNIVVPDTGAGTVGSGSTFSSSSAASIILPAIITALAIGAIVAMLVYKHRKHQNDRLSKKEKLVTAVSATVAVLSATVLVGNLVIPATSAATNVEPGTAELDVTDKITITATREADSDEVVIATVKNTSYATANLEFGYKITASMAEGLITANLYLDGDETSEYYIAPVEDGILTDNAWGYTLEEPSEYTTYLSIPLANDPTTIVKGSGEIEDEAVDIYYTIKVDNSLPTGTYTGELEYTLTDNNFPSTLTTMQGMTTEICENTFTPGNQVTDPVPTATLRDIRDDKTYTIAKLADGNCWMTQNLDLVGETKLYAETSDVPSDYPEGQDYYYQLPPSSFSGFADNTQASVYNSGSADCGEESPCYSYYSWLAANAFSGQNIPSGVDAPYSICPRNWRLPTTRDESSTDWQNQSDFYRLATAYGMSTDDVKDDSVKTGSNFYILAGPNTMADFNLSGYFYYGVFGGGGSLGVYGTSTNIDNDRYEYLSFNQQSINTATINGKKFGTSVRCLAQ